MRDSKDLAGPLGLCIAGPTASGKSALAMGLAQALASGLAGRPPQPVEIISVDSAQVYRSMDIGTAKPSAAERAAVPHHLIDIIEPEDRYSAAQFAVDAQQLAQQIRERGHLPLLVGGTMLYFKALREGISELPAARPELRAQIDAEAAERGWPALHAELALIDPATAARLAPRDAQRIQRALEVWRSSGSSLSDWHRASPVGGDAAGADARWPMLALEPEDRSWLHARIAQRFNQMLAAGFIEELKQLQRRPGLHAGLPSMRCVGYRQLWQALDESGPVQLVPGKAVASATARATAAPPAAWHEAALAATRQLAKRQLTWLRSVPGRQVLRCESSDLHAQALVWLKSQVRDPTIGGPR